MADMDEKAKAEKRAAIKKKARVTSAAPSCPRR